MRGISQFLEVERAVRWCRGFSATQIEACNKLWRALRDDIHQNTLYRVIRCLLQLGLRPMIKPRQLRLIVTISQGSDLALLWFLWEAYYKWASCGDESTPSYSYNEQLILTAIAHLDLPMTLSGLDKVMPLPQQPKQQQQFSKSLKRKPRQPGKTAGSARAGPYFEPQPRPQPFAAGLPKAGGKGPSRLAKPSTQSILCDSPRESLRWFANYELSPIKVEVKKCLSAALDRLFQCVGADQPPEPSLCHVHRMVEHTMLSRKNELTHTTMERCWKLLDVTGREQRQRSTRIVRQLEHEVLLAAEKLKQEKQRQLISFRELRQEAPCAGVCQMCVQHVSVPVLTNNNSDPAECNRQELPLLLPAGWNTVGHPLPTPAEEPGVSVLQLGEQKQLKVINVGPAGDCKANTESCPGPSPSEVAAASTAAAKPAKAVKSAIQLNVVEDVMPEPTEPSSSDETHCFRGSQMHGAPVWDYFRIFEPSPQSSSADLPLRDVQSVVHGYCVAALHEAMRGSEERQTAKVYGRRHVERLHLNDEKISALAQEAARECAKRYLASDSTDGRPQPEHQLASESSGRLKAEAIDPNNRQMLLELLKAACDILKQDARYVLVTLPNAHMLPMLVDWAEQRYGKPTKYSQTEEVAEYPEKMHDLIVQLAAQTPLPEIRHIRWPSPGTIIRANSEQLKEIRQDFHKMLRFRALEQSRLLWLALRNYSKLSPVDPKTFFAYMPARPCDIFLRLSRSR